MLLARLGIVTACCPKAKRLSVNPTNQSYQTLNGSQDRRGISPSFSLWANCCISSGLLCGRIPVTLVTASTIYHLTFMEFPNAELRPSVPLRECHLCKHQKKTSICTQCNKLAFCDDCWPTWVLHSEGSTGWGNRPHEKEDPEVVTQLRRILEPAPSSESQQAQEFEADDETTWFGVVRDSSDNEIIQDHGRFVALMTESHGYYSGERHPQLVSFVGQTGEHINPLSSLRCKSLD